MVGRTKARWRGGAVNTLFPNASASFKRINPHLFGVAGLPAAIPKPGGRGRVERPHPSQAGRPCRVVVSLVVFRRTALDDDNLAGGLKWLRDAIARSLGIDDGDRRVRFEYAQLATTGREGTAVKIERV